MLRSNANVEFGKNPPRVKFTMLSDTRGFPCNPSRAPSKSREVSGFQPRYSDCMLFSGANVSISIVSILFLEISNLRTSYKERAAKESLRNILILLLLSPISLKRFIDLYSSGKEALIILLASIYNDVIEFKFLKAGIAVKKFPSRLSVSKEMFAPVNAVL